MGHYAPYLFFELMGKNLFVRRYMMNPVNSVTTRIKGMSPGNPTKPVSIGIFKYHLQFHEMVDAIKNYKLFAPKDGKTIITTTTRPNMFLVYDPSKDDAINTSWKSWKYYEYAECQSGYYGNNYYVFGSGKWMNVLPETID